MEGQRDNQEDYLERDEFSFGNRGGGVGEGNEGEKVGDNKGKLMPPTSVMTRLILIMVWRKLIRNPNTYSSLIGLTWSLVSFRYPNYSRTLTHTILFFLFFFLLFILINLCFRWHIEMPAIIAKSISILSDAGLGMAMFSLGE